MTVDMLAATFFWPEGLLLGPEPSLSDPPEETRSGQADVDHAAEAPGFWSVLKRLFGAAVPSSETAPQG